MSSPIVQGMADALAAVTSAALSPVVNGPLLLAMLLSPDAAGRGLGLVAETLPFGLGARLPSSPSDLRGARATLSVLFALGLARLANGALSQAASNAWRWSRAPGWSGDWSGEVAVVTGGCSGIGLRIVERLVQLGARVAILDVQELPAGDQEGSDLRDSPLVRCYRCDVSSAASVAEAGRALRSNFGAAPSVLVNNAGIIHLGPILGPSEAELQRMFGVNCVALWLTTQEFLPAMVARGRGHVVTMSSTSAFSGIPGGAVYAATKTAAMSFHEALGAELRHLYGAPGVLTSVVHPNFTSSPMIPAGGIGGELRRQGVKLLTPDEVADAVVARLRSGRGGQVVVPERETFVYGLRGWPSWAQEMVRDGLGRGAALLESSKTKQGGR
jgi:all-trans-retinol dehydrogenase (NAD+)